MNASQFKKLPRRKQRLLIAKDVLKRLATKQLKPQQSVWVVPTADAKIGGSLQEYVKAKKPCQVCALGGIMASFAGFANAMNFRTNGWGDPVVWFQGQGIRNRLTKIFGGAQLRNIEAAFEKGNGLFRYDRFPGAKIDEKTWQITSPEIEKIKKFSRRYKSAKGRFRAIFQNIVKNKGEFVP